jgi:hypothetical protein
MIIKRTLTLALVGLTLGLGACDNQGQEQSQVPDKSQQGQGQAPGQQQGLTPQDQPPVSRQTPPPSSEPTPSERPNP